MIRLFLCLLGALLWPVRPDVRSRPAPSAAVPPIPRQARRTVHTDADLIARDHPEWRVLALPARFGLYYVAARGAHVVRANCPNEARRRIRAIDAEPPPALVRPYIYGRW